MKTTLFWNWALAVAITAALGLPAAAPAADAADAADTAARLGTALRAAAGFEYGKDAAALVSAEQIVMEASGNPAQRAAVEAGLLAALAAPGTRDAKEFLCRQLFTVGTERCVPALEGLLADPGLAHLARMALARNESPAAAAALRRGLTKTSGALRAGILNSLGLRADTASVPEIAAFLGSADPVEADAAAGALGRIGGAPALKALEDARGKAADGRKPALDAALLRAAEHALAAGQATPAARVYTALYGTDRPRAIRIAALRGLAQSQGERALPTLAEAVKGGDDALRAAALSFFGAIPGREATRFLAGLTATAGVEAQPLIMNALGQRGDGAALPEVLAGAQSPNQAARTAALAALGNVGDASVAGVLCRAAATGPEAAQVAARASLAGLSRGQVDAELAHLAETPDGKAAVEAVRALAARRATGSFGDVRHLAATVEPGRRHEAIHALGVLVSEPTLPQLLALAGELREEGDLDALEEAARAAFGRLAVPEAETTMLLAALGQAGTGAKPTLLRLLSATGTTGALTALRAALNAPEAPVADAAVRALADWPDATPAADLLEVVRGQGARTRKVLALRGYTRMASLTKDPAAMYARALDLAERVEDKKLVIGGMSEADPKQGLKLLEPFLAQAELKTEAALAMVQLADRLRATDLAGAKTAVRKALAAAPEPRIRQAAQEVVNAMEAFDGHILEWVAVGPFQEKDKDAHGLFKTVFPPEDPAAAGVKWTRVTKGLGAWDVNLAEALGGADSAVAYARTRVWSPSARPARLEMGSDDGIKAWLNGEVVHANDTERGLSPRQDLVKVSLKQGWNELLLKVTNQGGGWGFGCRVRQPDGAAMEDLKFEAQ